MTPAPGTGALRPRRTVLDRRGAPINLDQIEPLLAGIVERWATESIWLFGSRARGDAREWSDWDVFVVVSDAVAEVELGNVEVWRVRKKAGVRADIITCRASEFREDASTPNTLAHEVATTGVLVHER